MLGCICAIHLHISDYGEDHLKQYNTDRYGGGLEIHYRQPPNYMRVDAPSTDDCWLLKCPCWHDGSSLQASELWIPRWLFDKNNHDGMFLGLRRRYNEVFCVEEDEEDDNATV